MSLKKIPRSILYRLEVGVLLVSQIKRKLRGYSDDDWLLCMGDPAIIGVAFAVAADANRGRVNLLKWDKMEKIYYPVKVRVRGGIEELNP